jgi:hypothetical protein
VPAAASRFKRAHLDDGEGKGKGGDGANDGDQELPWVRVSHRFCYDFMFLSHLYCNLVVTITDLYGYFFFFYCLTVSQLI